MNVLVVFASVEGQTRKIAGLVERTVQVQGLDVALLDATNGNAKLRISWACIGSSSPPSMLGLRAITR